MPQVLVVDDEPDLRDLIRDALGELNLACDTARDGNEALERFHAQRCDVVVTDLKMPGRHGHSLAVNLLSQPKPPSVVVMSGNVELRLVQDLMRRGVQDIVWKPFDCSVMALKLLALVEKNRRETAAPSATLAGTASPRLARIERSLAEVTRLFAAALAGLFDFDVDLREPPVAVTDFIARFAKAEEEAADLYANTQTERRSAGRSACASPVVAVPVSRQFAPAGDPFMAAIRDVSEGGIRLLDTRATSAEYLALSWPAESLRHFKIRVVAHVKRCQPMGPFYNIAGEFVLTDC